jgi:hypothetical protein
MRRATVTDFDVDFIRALAMFTQRLFRLVVDRCRQKWSPFEMLRQYVAYATFAQAQ